ncbi:protein phosphatase 2C 70-like [Impatiens glandulifera]|uniref:protein phosphatase 2C 70-like n=1 Tax=Impatiens glandulifera TaxID=253017 RepID=UPI001FB08F68|nr:protein phosphatase 2C 70-like [Impatiens glandulifera]
MEKTVLYGIIVGGFILLMLLLILFLVLLACKPWRFFSRSSRTRTIKASSPPIGDDIERPLVSDDLRLPQYHQRNDFDGNYTLLGGNQATDNHVSSLHSDKVSKQVASATSQLSQSGSFILDVISESSDDGINATLRRPLVANRLAEEQNRVKKEGQIPESKLSGNASIKESGSRGFIGSNLTLEAISGPSRGLNSSIKSTNSSRLPLTLGRVAPSEILLKDSEISGKHAMINWNSNKFKWELVDLGSLNGTFLNSLSIHHPDSESRQWGDPVELGNGDIITFGTSTKVLVQITSEIECQKPFGLGVASDPMSARRGGKKLPMEDVCYYRWPLAGADQFGVFGICDGHGGESAAVSASKLLPEKVSSILSDPFRRQRVLSQGDASDVLRDAFSQTEACLDHYYEGCTATLLLVWADDRENYFAQCANVGDSACIIKYVVSSNNYFFLSESNMFGIKGVVGWDTLEISPSSNALPSDDSIGSLSGKSLLKRPKISCSIPIKDALKVEVGGGGHDYGKLINGGSIHWFKKHLADVKGEIATFTKIVNLNELDSGEKDEWNSIDVSIEGNEMIVDVGDDFGATDFGEWCKRFTNN